LKNKEKG